MRNNPYILFVFLFLETLFSFGQEGSIQSVVDMVSGDSIFHTIDRLQEMNRLAPGNDRECTNYIVEIISSYETDTVFLQEFSADYEYTSQSGLPNIIAVRRGSLYPDSVMVMGAHYDARYTYSSTEDNPQISPGADDNASGTSGVMEMIRVTRDFDFHKTLVFILFSGEEFGLYGSEHFVNNRPEGMENIYAMLNFDMISHDSNNGDYTVLIVREDSLLALVDKCILAMETYAPGLKYDEMITGSAFSDHASFQGAYIPSVTLIDGNVRDEAFNPYIHTLADTIGPSANSPQLAELITKAGLATLLVIDRTGYPAKIEYYKARQSYSVYPNPVEDVLTVEKIADIYSGSNISIYNSFGQMIKTVEMKGNSIQLDFSGYQNGLYILRFGDECYKILK